MLVTHGCGQRSNFDEPTNAPFQPTQLMDILSYFSNWITLPVPGIDFQIYLQGICETELGLGQLQLALHIS